MTIKEVVEELERRLGTRFSVFVFFEKSNSLGKGYLPHTVYLRDEANVYLANYDYKHDEGFWAASTDYVLTAEPGRLELIPKHTGLEITRKLGKVNVFEFLGIDGV